MLRILVISCLIGFIPASVQAKEKRPPNIILIFADDLGWADVGYQGSDFYETPNLDALTKRGMVFTNAYAGAGNCAPSRACLLSGQYTPRHGVYAVGDTNRGPKHLMRMIPIPNKSGLAKSQVTIADALKTAGYQTGIFGKWHLGGPDGASPKDQGFDVVYDSNPKGKSNIKGPPEDPKGAFSLTEKACEFIEQNKNQPFFCYLPHHAIHTPLQAQSETLKRFQKKAAGKQHKNPMYAACLADLDEAVGRLMKKLKELQLEENTLIIFTSDNGGTQQSSQEPLRGNKGCYYEGGIREPFIAIWKGVIAPGSKCDLPIHNVDLFPTFLEVAQAKLPESPLDGESFVKLFRGETKLQRQAIFWHFPGYLDNPVIRGRDPIFRSRPVSVIRKGDWKLHLYHEEWQLDGGKAKLASNQSVELYHLLNDLGERDNLAAKEPAKRDELLSDLLQWIRQIQAPLPSKPNPDYDPTKKGKE